MTTKRRRFAEGTAVSVEKSKAELGSLLDKHGAAQTGFFDDREARRAIVIFKMAGRQIRLGVSLPDPADKRFVYSKPGYRRTEEQRRAAWEQACREAWRRVVLITKAKLEIVADGDSTLEREFLADILLPDGSTVHEALAPKLVAAYTDGAMPPLLPAKGQP